MKIMLFGKDGQVGRALFERFSAPSALTKPDELVALGRAQVDLHDIHSLNAMLLLQAPAVIINAAAYTAVDRAESEAEMARAINTDAVAAMAAYARLHGALLVHYSTDYVFDGSKAAPYLESDATAPQSVYGLTKRDGETAILDSGCDALILRTSWVFSAQGGNFIKTMLRLAKDRDTLDVVADQHGAPTSATLIADATLQAIAAHRAGKLPGGIYHLTAAGATTWHALACHAITRARGNGVALKLAPENIRAIATSAYPTPARRPLNSQLDTRALATALNISFPDWRVDVDSVVDQLSSMKESL